MKPTRTLCTLTLAAMSVLAAGCAATDDKTTAEAKPAREYRTGSNIPVKDPTPDATQEDRNRTAEEVRALQRVGTGRKAGG